MRVLYSVSIWLSISLAKVDMYTTRVYNKHCEQHYRKIPMTFIFKYEDVTKKPNPMVKINPLKRGSGKTVSLQDRVDTLNKSAAWKKTTKLWAATDKVFDLSRLPIVSMEMLGVLDIDEDIQRALDDKHCANTIANPEVFDPALLQPVICIKTSAGKFISIDAQHTVSTIAGLIDAGLMPGHDDWKTFKYSFTYIETDNLAYARRAFSLLNGKGKKKQTQYQQLRNSVFIIRIDKDTSDEDDVAVEARVAAAEKHHCFPVEAGSDLNKHPGTFSNIATFKTMTADEIDLACGWHNNYFHYEQLHVSTFFIFRDMSRQFKSAKLSITPALLAELGGMVQNIFGNLSQFQESVTEAYRKWTKERWGYELPWDDKAYACALIELYRYFGGKEKVATGLFGQYDGLVEFFDQDIMNLAE